MSAPIAPITQPPRPLPLLHRHRSIPQEARTRLQQGQLPAARLLWNLGLRNGWGCEYLESTSDTRGPTTRAPALPCTHAHPSNLDWHRRAVDAGRCRLRFCACPRRSLRLLRWRGGVPPPRMPPPRRRSLRLRLEMYATRPRPACTEPALLYPSPNTDLHASVMPHTGCLLLSCSADVLRHSDASTSAASSRTRVDLGSALLCYCPNYSNATAHTVAGGAHRIAKPWLLGGTFRCKARRSLAAPQGDANPTPPRELWPQGCGPPDFLADRLVALPPRALAAPQAEAAPALLAELEKYSSLVLSDIPPDPIV